MHHFFADPSCVTEDSVYLTGDNYQHLVQVLRVRAGEQIMISDGSGTDYVCEVLRVEEESRQVVLRICFREEMHELPADIYLFQGLPKSDKMELIIQKAVELGVHAIVPVESRNTVVKLDDRKSESKLRRWQSIAEAAAKQSKRSVVPEILPVMKWKAAVERAAAAEVKLIPYENARGIDATLRELERAGALGRRKSVPRAADRRPVIAVMIGPEGGFDPEEVELAVQAGIVPVTLGKRILRTETAAICALSILMLTLEGSEAEA